MGVIMCAGDRELEECYERLYRGMVAKDSSQLQAILSDDFVLVHMTGMRQSKQEFIHGIQTGQLNYRSAATENILVSKVGDTDALLTGRSKVVAAVFGGSWHEWWLQLKIRRSYENSVWRMVEAVASIY